MARNKILFAVIVSCIVACNPVKHNDEIKIQIGVITMCVVNDIEINCDKFAEGPQSINFYFDIITRSGKNGILGSNTYYHFLDLDSLYYTEDDSGIMGRFVMVNRNDTLVLCSRGISIIREDTCQIIANIDLMLSSNRNSAFKDLFGKALKSPDGYKQYLYDYIKKSRFLYIPIVSDYKRQIGILKDRSKEELVYPQFPIEINKMKPLKIGIIRNEDETDLEFYSPE